MTSARQSLVAARRGVRFAIAFEIRMWGDLCRWILRRPVGQPDAAAFGYAKAITPVMGVFIGLSAIEIPILDLLLPWPTVRVIVGALGAYGLIWMVGLLATLRVNPHLVTPSGLRVRGLGDLDLTIPWDYIASIQANNRTVQGRNLQVDRTAEPAILSIAVMKQTNVDIIFRNPTILELPKGDTGPLGGLRIAADEPVAMVTRAREHLIVPTATRGAAR